MLKPAMRIFIPLLALLTTVSVIVVAYPAPLTQQAGGKTRTGGIQP